MEKQLRTELESFEDLIFDGKDININDFYVLKKKLLKDNHIDLLEIHLILDQTISKEFQNLKDENISPDEYIQIADVTSTQITSQISEFVTSKPPNEWQDSYINYMDALKNFNLYIIETKVYANLIKDGNTEKLEEIESKIQSYKSESEKMIDLSDSSRPR